MPRVDLTVRRSRGKISKGSLLTTLLHDMMHKEVDVDDMIVKSRGRDEHCAALREIPGG